MCLGGCGGDNLRGCKYFARGGKVMRAGLGVGVLGRAREAGVGDLGGFRELELIPCVAV